MPLAKLTGVITVASGAGVTVTRTNGGDTATYDADFIAGDYYVQGAGADDLLTMISEAITGVAAAWTNFTITLNSTTGIVSMALGAGETGTLDWTANGGATNVRDWLRFSGSTTSLSATATSGSRTHSAGLYPALTVVEDLPRKRAVSTQARADDGTTETVHYATRTEHELVVHFQGGPRESAYEEFQALEDLIVNHAAKGERFRYFPDKTISAAFAEVSAPYGFQTFVAAGPLDWEPSPLFAGWYEHWHWRFELLEYVS